MCPRPVRTLTSHDRSGLPTEVTGGVQQSGHGSQALRTHRRACNARRRRRSSRPACARSRRARPEPPSRCAWRGRARRGRGAPSRVGPATGRPPASWRRTCPHRSSRRRAAPVVQPEPVHLQGLATRFVRSREDAGCRCGRPSGVGIDAAADIASRNRHGRVSGAPPRDAASNAARCRNATSLASARQGASTCASACVRAASASRSSAATTMSSCAHHAVVAPDVRRG